MLVVREPSRRRVAHAGRIGLFAAALLFATTAPAMANARDGRLIDRYRLASRCVHRAHDGTVRVTMVLRMERPHPLAVRVDQALGTGPLRRCPAPRRGRPGGFWRYRLVAERERVPVGGASVRRRVTLRLRLKPGLYRVMVQAHDGFGDLTFPRRRFLRVLGS